MSAILLLLIGAIAPWAVHLAPPRQRAFALVGVIAVFLLYWIFAENPLARWETWAGLAVGILSVLFLAGGGRGGRGRGRPSRPRPARAPEADPLDDLGDEPTGGL